MAPLKVITAVVNNPVFIQIQYYTLRKYMKCEYEFIVFNDAKGFPDYSNGNDVKIKRNIRTVCKQLGIQCIDIPNQQHRTNMDAAIRCADSMNFILEYQRSHPPDQYLLIDSDMFLMDDFYPYAAVDCAVVLQQRDTYFWNGLYYFDFTKMKDTHLLNWNCTDGCDVGGMMQQWWRHRQHAVIATATKQISHLCSGGWTRADMPAHVLTKPKLLEFIQTDPRNAGDGTFYCEIYDGKFLHYRAGGNWERRNMLLHVNLALKLRAALL